MDKFNILPLELVLDIFARLPTELLLDCKSVSKTWRNHIQHPSFSHMHLNRLNYSATATDSGKLSFLALASNQQLYYFEYNENHEIPIGKIKRVNLKLPRFECNHTFIGSFNGLICLRYWDHSFCICNPMTKEYVILPKSKSNFGLYKYWSCGFGYLPSTNEYKVAAIYTIRRSIHVEVYTLGNSKGWRNLGRFEFRAYSVCGRPGIFLNGALYWRPHGRRVIVVFDLSDENVGEKISLPASRPGGGHSPTAMNTIGVLGGCLFCTTMKYLRFDNIKFDAHTKRKLYDIWLYKKRNDDHDMKERELHNFKIQSLGWTTEFKQLPNKNLLAITKSGGILSYTSEYLNIYDPKTSTSERLAVLNRTFHQVFPHQNTLLSLKLLGEEDTKIMESAVKEEEGLRFSIF